jgi:hypothetical protein
MGEGTEWGRNDRERAQEFYASLRGYTKLFFDLLIDHPGERIDADQITAYFARHSPKGNAVPNRLSVAGSLTPVWRKSRASGRPPPHDWWKGAHGAASLYAMKPIVARLFGDARMKIDPGYAGNPRKTDWSAAEVRTTVADYLEMLAAEASDRQYSKAAHRRKLRLQLNEARTDSAIEFKYHTISAAMLDLGLPYIRGYKPRGNYQSALITEIQRRLEAHPQLLRTLRAGTDSGTPPDGHLQRTPPPGPSAPTAALPPTGSRMGRHMDYGLLQEENRRRGAQGEKLVADYERAWLHQHGLHDLASRVQWTAHDSGDGVGYDVLSFDLDGQKRYIEVKTTARAAETPFYITPAELGFAQRHIGSYALYRVYDVLGQPRFFGLEGDITDVLALTPATYSARIAATTSATRVLSGAATKPVDDRMAPRMEK